MFLSLIAFMMAINYNTSYNFILGQKLTGTRYAQYLPTKYLFSARFLNELTILRNNVVEIEIEIVIHNIVIHNV